MIMAPKEFDIVYIFNHNSDTVEQCRVVVTDFGSDGQCLVYGLTSEMLAGRSEKNR